MTSTSDSLFSQQNDGKQFLNVLERYPVQMKINTCKSVLKLAILNAALPHEAYTHAVHTLKKRHSGKRTSSPFSLHSLTDSIAASSYLGLQFIRQVSRLSVVQWQFIKYGLFCIQNPDIKINLTTCAFLNFGRSPICSNLKFDAHKIIT